jgi:hypothetical protein
MRAVEYCTYVFTVAHGRFLAFVTVAHHHGNVSRSFPRLAIEQRPNDANLYIHRYVGAPWCAWSSCTIMPSHFVIDEAVSGEDACFVIKEPLWRNDV